MTPDIKKRKVADLLFSEGRAIHTLSNLKKNNSSPEYDGKTLIERANSTVGNRAKRYGRAILGMTDKNQ